MIFVLLRWFVFLCFLSTGVFAQENLRLNSIALNAIENKKLTAEINLELSQAADAKIFLLENPERIVIDLPKAQWNVKTRDTKNAKWFERLRYANTANGSLRLVIESKRDIQKVAKARVSKTKNKQTRLVFSVTFSKNSGNEKEKNKSEKKEPEGQKTLEKTKSEKKSLQNNQNNFASPQLKPQPPIKNNDANEKTLSSAHEPPPLASVLPHANLATPIPIPVPRPTPRLPLIVIDAGHGGKDPGAQGKRGTIEKNLTLSYAKHLDVALRETQRFQTALSRTDDSYIPLQDRVAFARNVRGDFFISLHADSHQNPKTRGLSVYTLSEKASDREAALLAEHDNLSEVLPGNLPGSIPLEVSHALFGLTQQQTNNNSAMFAELLVKKLQARVSLLPHPHRYAGFRVLKAVDIPSVLIELGYLSNPREEFLLSDANYKKQLVNAIVDAIEEHFVRFPVERSFQ